MLFIIAGIGCALARSLPTLLMWRVVQGAGAGASMTIALAIVRDLFEGQAARTKLSYVALATTIVPMIAPTAGAALLALGGWRVIHSVLAESGSSCCWQSCWASPRAHGSTRPTDWSRPSSPATIFVS
jgi:MFS transporter, DHA1 family, multidrug resistance protein